MTIPETTTASTAENKNNNVLKIKRLTDTAHLPTRATPHSAGLDLYADLLAPVYISPHETIKIGTGIAVQLPAGTFGGLYARSGLATYYGITPANCVGIIDEDYTGEIIVALHNNDSAGIGAVEISPGQRIAQLIVQPYTAVNTQTVDELDKTLRDTGGFGSTGE